MGLNLFGMDVCLTKRCNLNCAHCGIGNIDCDSNKNNKNVELSINELSSLISQAAKEGIKHIIFSGGEPFLREDLFDILEMCEQREISFAILSNGTLINDEVAQKLRRYKRLAYVRISLDYPTKAEMDAFRGMDGVFDAIKNAIDVLVHNNIICGIGMSIMQTNIDKVSDVAELALKYGADFFRAVPIVSIGKSKDTVIDNTFYKRALNNVLKAHEIVNLDLGYATILLPKELEKIANNLLVSCPGGERTIAIANDGTLLRCPLSGAAITDKTIKNTSLHELAELNYAKMIKKEKIAVDLCCKNCYFLLKCSGGCMCELESRVCNGHEEQQFCFKEILESVLSDRNAGKRRRNVINNIICRQNTQAKFNVPMCFRSSPIWWFPLKIRKR